MPESRTATEVGAGRVLCLVYAFFTLAAGARSGVQLATRAAEAPLAYSLSALAAVIYLTGLVLLIRADLGSGPTVTGSTAAVWARLLCQLELAGVLVIGAASRLLPSAFPEATVWSNFGQGYGFVPLVLPVAALLWLPGRGDPGRAASSADAQKVPSGSVSGSGRRNSSGSDAKADPETG